MKPSGIKPLQAPERLSNLFKAVTGLMPETVTALPQSGSSRRYFRLTAGSQSLIGTENPAKAENLAFRHFSQVFRSIGLPVPEVLAMSRDNTCYLQQDLGDQSLYGLMVRHGGAQQAEKDVLDRFRQALAHLAIFQVEAHKSINYRKFAFSGPRFDKAAILDDLQYFRYFFLKLHPELVVNEKRLIRDMERFAGYCASAPSDYFMYRDFQSRNIMVFNGSNYYIDFQGGRQGALQYDVVSLLWQAAAGFAPAQRETLIVSYKNQLDVLDPLAAATFDTYLPAFVHLRQMQVLGAYGLRGLVQHKAHFLKSIPPALRAVEDNLRNFPLPSGLPELSAVLGSLSGLHHKYPLLTKNDDKVLKVNIFSFSFLQGGPPADSSGNGGGFVFDCRSLPNPGREEQYRKLTGRDDRVKQYLLASDEVHEFLSATSGLILQSIDNYIKRGFTSLSVGFGCTGGQHRSVFCAETIAAELKKLYPGVEINLWHQNIGN
ncbi:MAG: phosphotransferase [Bacteroidia bacterium]|nr:phosphotransferase [Bacteroidia bacterium]